mgnify:FL=1
MKIQKLKPLLVFLLSSFMILSSCRTEDDASIGPPIEETLAVNSSISKLINRTSQRDGSLDNIIDNASCVSVQLPVTVIANGVEVLVSNTNDYQSIEDIFDAQNTDTDSLEIVFPITLIFADFSTTVVSSNSELAAYIAQCAPENAEDEDIECIDFQYPITTSIFDQNKELVNTIVITNDQQMHDFIENIDDYAAATINFPITVILADGSLRDINSITELQTVIENADNTCDEDDDNDYNDDDCDFCNVSQLENLFANCTQWSVSELELNNRENLENQYAGYSFSFQSNGTITVTENGNTSAGTWSVSGAGNEIIFLMNIPNLTDFNGSWNLHEIDQEGGQEEIEFKKGGEDELKFRSQC